MTRLAAGVGISGGGFGESEKNTAISLNPRPKALNRVA